MLQGFLRLPLAQPDARHFPQIIQPVLVAGVVGGVVVVDLAVELPGFFEVPGALLGAGEGGEGAGEEGFIPALLGDAEAFLGGGEGCVRLLQAALSCALELKGDEHVFPHGVGAGLFRGDGGVVAFDEADGFGGMGDDLGELVGAAFDFGEAE